MAGQGGKCALCGCGLTAGTCELDHVVPVRQAFAGSVQTLQALCGDCHSEKTLRESAQPTSLESRVAPGVMEYARPSCLLWFLRRRRAQRPAREALCTSAWTWCAAGATGWPTPPSPCPFCARRTALSPWTACCRTWALWRAAATRGSPASICCRTSGWYPKVSLAAMLDLGVCRWDHIVLGISARSHVDAATLRRALERMDAAWPEPEEHMAKLSVNAMIGLWARSTEVVYSVRSSSSELDGAGADFSQAFAYEGGMVWDFVYARRLLSNGTYRPILGFEHCMVKTDCVLTQRLPKRFTERLRALEALRHPDGTPVYRVEETRPLLLGSSRAPRMEAERPKQRRWNGVDDKPLPGGQLPAAHGPAGHRKDAPGPDDCGEAARAGRGGAPGVQDALLRAEPGPGGRRRPTTGCAGTCAGAARKSWTGWWWRRSRSWTWRSGRTWPAWG